MTRQRLRWILGLAMLGAAWAAPAQAEEAKAVERRLVVRTVRSLEQTLAQVESAAIKERPQAVKRLRNSTLLTQAYVADKLTRSGQPEVVYPAAMVAFLVKQVDQGTDASALAKAELALMQQDGFASVDAEIHAAPGGGK